MGKGYDRNAPYTGPILNETIKFLLNVTNSK